MSFKPPLRNEAEAVFKGRAKDSAEFVEYEFADHPGTLSFRSFTSAHLIANLIDGTTGTVHGFAARPNMAISDAKEGFEKAFAAAVAWFKKTLG